MKPAVRRIALLERFWQARHPPRYAAYLISSSPTFPHSSDIAVGRAHFNQAIALYDFAKHRPLQ